jgi:predicted metal-dependent phosphoesterase TrpH
MRDIMLMDLHTHTTASDGSLSPAELVARAVALSVPCISITDHDSIGAYAALPGEVIDGVTVIPGVEFSTTWSGRNIHVLGLNIDPHNEILQRGIQHQQTARNQRAEKIAYRLRTTGINELLEKVRLAANGATIGRPHFAQVLVDEGSVANLKQAYRKFLGNGKPGDVRQYWAEMTHVIDWICASGGTAVLAHPLHYQLTATKLRQLCTEFKASGGQAIEVCNGIQTEALTQKLAVLCEDLELLASCGSDFHHGGNSWSEIGKFSPLPASCRPVWDHW